MNVEYLILADYVVVAHDGKTSAIGIFDSISTDRVPMIYASLGLVGRLTASLFDGSEHELMVTLLDADARLVFQSPPARFTLTPRGPGYGLGVNLGLTIGGIVLPDFGDYVFALASRSGPLDGARARFSVLPIRADAPDDPA